MDRKTKAEVKYTPKAMDPNERCKLCAHFYVVGVYGTGRCTRVEGEINPQGWCKLFCAASVAPRGLTWKMKYWLLPFFGIGHILLFGWIAAQLVPWIGWLALFILPLSVPLVFGPVGTFLFRGRRITLQDYATIMKQPPWY